MSEKLLKMPPFKYIFDIITKTTQITGFAEGLYGGNELNSSWYITKEYKMLYLSKIIAYCARISDKEIDINIMKVLAGKEPEKTNGFLQLLYDLAINGKNKGEIVKEIVKKFEKEENELVQLAVQQQGVEHENILKNIKEEIKESFSQTIPSIISDPNIASGQTHNSEQGFLLAGYSNGIDMINTVANSYDVQEFDRED